MVRSRALRLLKDEATASDIAQETFVRLIEHRKKKRSEDNTAGFLYRTATNLALNHLRDGKRRRVLLASQDWHEATPAVAHQQIALREAFGRAKPEDSTVASYYYVDGLEHQEIADLLGMQRRTVGRRLERFRITALSILGSEISRPEARMANE